MNVKKTGICTGIFLVCALCFSPCNPFLGNKPPVYYRNHTPYDKFIELNGIAFHYVEYPGQGRDVVLLHGFASSTYTWQDVMPLLHERGFHVWALDMKGFGWSDKPLNTKYDPVTLMEEVKQWMDAVGISRAVIAGNSLGGAVAWMLALEHPDTIERLVLIDAGGYVVDRKMAFRYAKVSFSGLALRKLFSPELVRSVFRQVMHNPDNITIERVNAYYSRLATQNALYAQTAFLFSVDDQLAEKYAGRIPEIRQPTLIIWGRDDRWIPLAFGERFHREIPGSILKIIPECGHVPQEEHPEEVAELIAEFAVQ